MVYAAELHIFVLFNCKNSWLLKIRGGIFIPGKGGKVMGMGKTVWEGGTLKGTLFESDSSCYFEFLGWDSLGGHLSVKRD